MIYTFLLQDPGVVAVRRMRPPKHNMKPREHEWERSQWLAHIMAQEQNLAHVCEMAQTQTSRRLNKQYIDHNMLANLHLCRCLGHSLAWVIKCKQHCSLQLHCTGLGDHVDSIPFVVFLSAVASAATMTITTALDAPKKVGQS